MATRNAAGGVKITVPATWIASWTLYDLANTIWSYGIFSYAIGLYLTSEQGLGEINALIPTERAIEICSQRFPCDSPSPCSLVR